MALLGSSCIFPSPDIKKTAGFYEKLGFSAVEYLQCNEPHICLYCDKTEIILTQSCRDKIVPHHTLHGYGYDAYIYTDQQAEWQEKCKALGITVIKPLVLTDYSNREFVMEDIDGRWIAFGLKNPF